MIENFAKSITLESIKRNVVPKEDKDIYIYGWSVLISSLLSTVLMLLTGFVAGEFLGTCFYLLFFISMRVIAGGYHASTYLQCFICTFIFYSIAFTVRCFLPKDMYLLVIVCLMAASGVITFLVAPVDHPNKPLSNKRKEKFKHLSRIVFLMQSVIVLTALYWGDLYIYHFILWAALGSFITNSSLLFVLLFKPYRKEPS